MNQNQPDTPRPFREAVNDTVQQPSLSEQQLEHLMALQQQAIHHDAPETPPPRKSWHWRWAVASLMVIGLSLSLLWTNPQDYSRDIALEVVENHLKLKPLDVSTHSMQGIQEFFTQLDFSPARSSVLDSHFSLTDTQLLGGRYCSIKGDTAAQIRYQSDTGVATFYQVDYHSERFGPIPGIDKNERPLAMNIKGLNVSMWVEMGLLMVLIENP